MPHLDKLNSSPPLRLAVPIQSSQPAAAFAEVVCLKLPTPSRKVAMVNAFTPVVGGNRRGS